jgi:hypothetical protein
MEASMITIPYPGGQHAGTIAVEEAEAFLGAVMVLITEEGGNLKLDLLLQAACGQLGDQLPSGAAIEERRQGGGARICLRHGSSG